MCFSWTIKEIITSVELQVEKLSKISPNLKNTAYELICLLLNK